MCQHKSEHEPADKFWRLYINTALKRSESATQLVLSWTKTLHDVCCMCLNSHSCGFRRIQGYSVLLTKNQLYPWLSKPTVSSGKGVKIEWIHCVSTLRMCYWVSKPTVSLGKEKKSSVSTVYPPSECAIESQNQLLVRVREWKSSGYTVYPPPRILLQKSVAIASRQQPKYLASFELLFAI